uniref:ATP synthase F0 subunit 8 n=1 Tax=Damon diadema TaxID=317680 RepID=B5U6K2_9ARAC|nr:ATP synthase F0 subunit 8 [Damon diadema]ACI02270.1 ATP synthase F0 subunit 8 [Damon diadema]
MPQMAPMMWMLLMLMSTFFIILTMTKIFFFQSPYPFTHFPEYSLNQKSWTW